MTVVVNQLVAGTSKRKALAMRRFEDDLGIGKTLETMLIEDQDPRFPSHGG